MFSLFGTKRAASAIVIDIGSSSIGGAFVSFPKDGPPVMPFSVRLPISFPDKERSPLCMLRSLETVCNQLYELGRPAFHRATGDSRPDRVVIALGAPWQETRIETERVSGSKPFTFTRDMLMSAIKKRSAPKSGQKDLQNEVVAILLNGYETSDPYGKRAERAEIIFLSSSMDGETMTLVARAARRFGAPTLLAPTEALAHTVLRTEFPHDKDFILMLVSDEATSVMVGKQGIVLDARSVPIGLRSLLTPSAAMKTLHVNEGPPEAKATEAKSPRGDSWTNSITEVLKELATKHALPRIVFLAADDGSAASLKRFFDTAEMHALWLSDESLTVIPVISKLTSSLIRHQGQGEPDVMLDLLTLFARLRLSAAK